eukprot:COSAG06_NODE_3118_length_5830_cov_5.051649_4_plen_134_part_00
MDICRNCDPKKGCSAVDNPPTVNIKEHGQVAGEANMLAEIYARGPIAVTVACPPAFENYTGGVFEDKTGDVSLDHSVEVVGWGTENGVKYWVRGPCMLLVCRAVLCCAVLCCAVLVGLPHLILCLDGISCGSA